MRVIDAENMVLGRLASHLAKGVLDGDEIRVINAEKTILTGSKRMLLEKYKKRQKLIHSRKGPHYPRRPDRILKRSVRGMIPYQKPRGRKAFKRLRVYLGVPHELKDHPVETIDEAAFEGTTKYMYLGDISRALGSKF